MADTSIIIEVPSAQRRKIGLYTYISDFANILKLFVGSIFLAIPFGFAQCGLAFGVVGLIVISLLTAHCGHLLIKCRYHSITHILRQKLYPNNFMLRAHNSRKPVENGVNLQIKVADVDQFMDHLTKQGFVWPEKKFASETHRSEGESGVFKNVHDAGMMNKGYLQCTKPSKIKTHEDEKLGSGDEFKGNDTRQKTTHEKTPGKCTYGTGLGYGFLKSAKLCASSSTDGYKEEREPEKSEALDETYLHDLQRSLVKFLQYGDIARLCLGSFGIAFTNFLIIVTQIGFCTNYFIFIANAIVSFFPVYNCTLAATQNGSNTSDFNIVFLSSDCQRLKDYPWLSGIEMQQIGTGDKNIGAILLGLFENKTLPGISPLEDLFTNFLWTPGFPTTADLLTNISNAAVPANTKSTVITSSSYVATPPPTPALNQLSTFVTNQALLEPVRFPMKSISSKLAGNSTSVSNDSSIHSWQWSWSNAPNLGLMVLVPMAPFIVLILPRKLRVLGIFSVIGNLGLVTSIVVIFTALIDQFQISSTWQWALPQGLPMFFGTTAGAFEGAGMMLPIEASMEGNQHNFPLLLYGSIGLVMLIFIGLTVTSYLSFGSATAQLITMNFMAGSTFSTVVNVCLLIGILFTFPLMMFPLVRMAETAIDNIEKTCRNNGDVVEETSSLLKYKPKSRSLWKSSLVRIALVLITCSIAVFLRKSFAYVSAFVGALGSMFVAFVLPCIFHLRLCWSSLPLAIKIKDLIIIVVALLLSITGMYTVVRDMMITST